MKLTVESLATILNEEFGSWGDIDSYLFHAAANPNENWGEVFGHDVSEMRKVLAAVILRLNSNTERVMKVGDSIWHVYFTLTGQVSYPGKITKIDGEYGRIYCRVAWPDGVEEAYEEHELSLDDPREKE